MEKEQLYINYSRSISITHNGSPESEQAVNEILAARTGRETITVLDARDYNWAGEHYYELPYIVTPDGNFQGLEGFRAYVNKMTVGSR